MDWTPGSVIRRWFDPQVGASDRLIPRWIFLRALGLIYFSAFFSLIFQIRGLIGPEGILPAGAYLEAVEQHFGPARFWFAPTLLWLSSGNHMLMAICWIGILASVLLILNVWPRGMLFVCFVCFLSFVAAAQDFSGYQSDGMLLEAGFLSLFFAPAGFWPGLGRDQAPPSRASLFLLQWEWFRIYFESGMVKLASGDPEWRNFTAMDEYYQNGPLPTWVGWYVRTPAALVSCVYGGRHAGMELGLVFMLFFPRRVRARLLLHRDRRGNWGDSDGELYLPELPCAVLGFLLLDDRFVAHFLPDDWKQRFFPVAATLPAVEEKSQHADPEYVRTPAPHPFAALKLALTSVMLLWIFYTTTVQAGVDIVAAAAAAHFSGGRAGTVSYRQPLRAVCGDDTRAL